jgi:hypothetical protein
MAVTWLNQQRFDDYKPPPEAESKERDEFMRSRGYDWIDGKWKKVEAA